MKKIMLSMLVMLASTIFATSAVAQTGTLAGVNTMNSDVWVAAINTSTSQVYYLQIHANLGGPDSIMLPVGDYTLIVDTIEDAHIYITDDDDSEEEYGISWTPLYFYGITINSSYTTVVAAYYP